MTGFMSNQKYINKAIMKYNYALKIRCRLMSDNIWAQRRKWGCTLFEGV